MKSLFLILVLFSLINSVHAQNLCDESCELTVTFPEGGSLEATDALTLTFGTGGELILGTGGTVNTAIQPSTLDFLSGGTLTLSARESITFGPGGSLVLGTEGNMDALDYSLTTTGDLTIEATGGNQIININGDLNASGAMTITSNSLGVNSTISAGTQLNLQDSTNISGAGSIINYGTLVLSTGNESPTISDGTGSVTLSTGTGSAEISAGTVENIVTSGTVQPGSLVVHSNPIVTDTTSTLSITPPNTESPTITGSLILQPLTSLDPFNGLEIPTNDGNNCIVESPECVADDGTVYVLDTESKLVKKEAPSDTSTSDKSGSFGLSFLGFFMILLLMSRRQRN